MGLLDELLAGMAGGGMGGQDMGREGMGRQGTGGRSQAPAASGGMGNILMALLPVVLSMLASRGAGGQGRPGPAMGGGGLDDLLGQVLGGGGGRGGAGGMGDILGQVLGGGGQGGMGGLGALLEQLQRTGYGDQASSWVGTGQNLPISPEAMEQVFGRGGLAAIARQAGVTEADASRGLSELLPEVVDRVTPGGEVPDFDSLTASVEALTRRLG
jgi:uncharacterized protein YidB (DUF937 family)